MSRPETNQCGVYEAGEEPQNATVLARIRGPAIQISTASDEELARVGFTLGEERCYGEAQQANR